MTLPTAEAQPATLHRRALRDVEPQPWRNGGGQTRELLTWPATDASAPWQLRLSVADIEADGPFSAFPGVQRHFAVLHGAGVALRWPGRSRRLEAGDEALAFDGATPPDCTLLAGPTRDLNLMLQGGATGRLWRLRQGGEVAAPAGTLLGVYAAQAAVLLGDDGPLQLPADTLLWTTTGARWRCATEAESGGGLAPCAYAFAVQARPTP